MRLVEKLKQLRPWFLRREKQCEHVNEIQSVQPRSEGCEECLQSGDTWFHLRVCLTCGHVGCCDASKNKHATKHFQETGHPLIQSGEEGEDWIWCYADRVMLPGSLAK